MKKFLPFIAAVFSIVFSHAQDGPGGVGSRNGVSALKVWLDGGDPTNVITITGPVVKSWLDKSGNSNHASTTTGTVAWGSTLPTYATNQVNGNAAVQLRGVPIGNEAMASAGSTPDVFALIKINSYVTSGIAICNPDNGFSQGTYRTGPDWGGAANKYSSNASNGALLATPTGNFPIGTYGITNFYYGIDQGTNQSIMSLNGIQTPFTIVTGNWNTSIFNKYWLGRYPAGGHDQDCDISEVIVYNSKLNNTQRFILENYLASKYAIGTIANDFYQGDTPGNGNYDLAVIGTGQQGASDKHTVSFSDGGLNLTITSSVTTGAYLFAGHNKSMNTVTSNNLSGAVLQRWDRDFYLDKTGNLSAGNSRISFNFLKSGLATTPGMAANYTLLYRSTSGGTFSEVSVAAVSIQGNEVIFDVTDANLVDGYYTIGTKNVYASNLGIQTNNALNFDGTNDIVDLGNLSALNGASKFTIELWAYQSSVQGDKVYYMKKGADNNNRIGLQNVIGRPNDLYLFVSNGSTQYAESTGGTLIQPNVWNHIAMVYDGSGASNTDKLKLFVNGNPITLTYSGTLPSVSSSNSNSFILGAQTDYSPSFFNGTQDEIRIWSTARTQAQIQNSYNQSLTGNESGLVAYYPFNHGVAGGTNTGLTSLIDVAGTAENGTLSGFTLNGASSNWVSGVSFPASTLTGTPNILPTSSSSTFQATTGDFNGDGNLDVAAANQDGDNISVFLGNGNGNFTSVVNYSAGDGTTGIVTGDFNSDGKLDLISMNAGTPGNITVYTGTGTGTFGGRVDIATGPVRNASVGDFNKDGNLDLVIANPNSNNFWLLTGTGTGNFGTPISFTLSAGSYFSTSIADFNKDGNLDVIAVNYINNLISVRLGNGVGGFGSETTYATGGNTAIFADIADINQDSNLDILVANQNSSFVSVFTGTGTGTFGSVNNSYLTTPSQGVSAVIAKDINGDGLLDILASNLTGSNISVLTSTGNGGFASYFNINPGGQVWHLVSDDINNDGKPDIICALAAANAVSVILNTFSTPAPTFVSITSPLSVCGSNGIITANFSGSFLTYQWYRNGVSIAGANTVTLTSAVSGAYYVVASNIAGSATSSVTTITACNNALQFNGNSGVNSGPFINVSNNSNDFNLGTNFTMEAWINPTTAHTVQTIFSKGSGQSADGGFIFQVNANKLQFYNNGWINSDITVPTNTWSHVAISYSNGLARFFLNGVNVTSLGVNLNINPAAGDFFIGNQGNPTGLGGCYCNRFNGQIDEVRIWNVARTPNDIQANLYRTIQGNLSGLVAAYNFNHGIGGANNAGITTLIDQVNGNHNGVLNGFALTGSGSNWVGSITTISGTYAFAAPFIEMGVAPTICLNATATYTITASGQGSFSYQWYRNGSVLAGQNTSTLNLTTSLTSTLGTYFVLVSSSNGTSTSTGVVFPNCNNALDFDGGNDELVVGDFASLNLTSNFTAEAWVYNRLNTVVDGDYINTIFSKKLGGAFPGWSLFINEYNTTNGKLVFEASNGNNLFSTNTNVVPVNQWSHVAVSVSNGVARMYVNGNEIPSTWVGSFQAANSSTSFRIGNFEGTSFYNNGIIDEARIWNIGLSQQDIQNNRFKNISTTTPGLVGYWDFNQGIPSGNNTAITTALDKSGNNFGGTLANMALNGGASNFVLSSQTTVIGIYTFSSPIITGITASQTVCSGVTVPLSVSVTGSGLGYQWRKDGVNIAGATASSLTLTGVTTTTVGVYSVIITSLGGNLTSSGIALGVGCNNALDFDGVDDFLFAAHSASLNAVNELTIDFWVYRRGNTGQEQSYIDKVTSVNNTNYRPISNNSGSLIFYNGTTSGSGGTLSNNVWTHLAYVINGTDLRIYVNGSQVFNGVVGLGLTNNGGLFIGKDWNGRNVLGAMDELRIWNKALSSADVAQNYNKKSTGNEVGLMAYYNFDQGVSGGNNTGITSIIDRSPNGNNATFNNFSLNNTSTSNFTTSGANITGTFSYTTPSVTGITPNQTVCSGVIFPLSVTVSGTGLGYQWRKDGVNIAGATASTLTLTGVTTTSAGIYSVVVTSLGGNLTSSGISLGVGCNNALDLQGTTNLANGTYTAGQLPSGNSDFTFETWINYKSSNVGDNYFVWWGNASTSEAVLGIGYKNTREIIISRFGSNDKTTNVFLPNSTWAHIALTYRGATRQMDLYLNGVLSGTLSGATFTTDLAIPTSGNIQLGSYNSNASFFSNVILDETSLWNVALSQADIQRTMNRTLVGTETGLSLYYDYNHGIPNGFNAESTILVDRNIPSQNLTLSNFSLNGTSSSNWVGSVVTSAGIFTFSSPSITGISVNQTVCSGVTLPLSVTVMGSGLAYQWRKDGVNIAGATASTLTLTGVTTTSVGIYSVVITSLGGNLTSSGISVSIGCNNALDFDGADDAISVGASPLLNNLATNEFTFESWIKIPNSASAQSIIRKTGDYNFFIYNQNLYIEIWPNGIGNSTWRQYSGTQNIALGQWVHVAVSYKNNVADFYINGVKETISSFSPGNNSNIENLGIGYSSIYSNFILGQLDEVRIWNKALSQEDIQTNRFKNFSNTVTGLVAYYDFNQGLTGGNNSGLTTLVDKSGNNHNGTLQNFSLTSSTSNFVSAANTTTITSPFVYYQISITGITSSQTVCSGIILPLSVTVSGSGVSYQWQKDGVNISGATSSTFTLTGVVSTTAGVYSVVISSLGGNLTSSGINISVGCNNALDFNGSSSYINLPISQTLNDFSIEFWFNVTSGGANYSRILSSSSSLFELAKMADGSLQFYAGSLGQGWSPIFAPTLNEWHHFALVRTSSTIYFYIDGVQQNAYLVNSNSLNITGMRLGAQLNVLSEYGKFQLDEFRMWNKALSLSEITTNKNRTVGQNYADLILAYDFNQGTANGVNNGINIVNDQSGQVKLGTMSGFALNGNSSNWISSPVSIVGNYTYVSPAITFISPSQSVCNGVVLPLNVVANGSGITYQWRFNGNTITGATASSYSIVGVNATNTGVYSVAINSLGGNIASGGINISVGCNNSIDFDGVDDRISSTYSSGQIPSGNQDWTFQSWVYYKGGQINDRWFAWWGASSGADQQVILGINGSTNNLKVNRLSGNDRTLSTLMPVNSWTHLSLVYTGSNRTMKVFVNGVLTNTINNYTADLNIPTTGTFELGTFVSSTIYSSNIILDEVRLFNVALSDSDVNLSRNRTVNGSTTNLALYYDFNQGLAAQNNTSNTVLNDVTSNPLNLNLSNFGLTSSTSNWVSSPITFSGLFNYGLPTITGISQNQTICSGFSVPLSVTATGSGLTYQWLKDGVSIAGATNSVITLLGVTPTTSGVYSVAINNLGGNITSAGISIEVNSSEINIKGNGTFNIASGDLTPSPFDGTNFGSSTLTGQQLRSFIIENLGSSPLRISNISLSGANPSDFTFQALPNATISGGGSSSFQIIYLSTSLGIKNANVVVYSNDCDEAAYTFAITASTTALGTALDFDGVDDYVSFPSNNTGAPLSQITLEGWIYSTNISPTFYSEIIRSNNTSLLFSFQDNGTILSFGASLSSYAELDIPITRSNYENQWVHLAATYDGSTKRVYRNGVLIGSAPATGNILASNLFYVGSAGVSSEFFQGKMDEIRVWNRALSQAEIISFMSCNPFINEAGLYSRFDFNQGIAGQVNSSVTTVIDKSGNGNNATAINFALSGINSNWTTDGRQNPPCLTATEISVKGNGISVPIFSSPSNVNGTDFGNVYLGFNSVTNFSIENIGNVNLSVTSINISGADASQFAIEANPTYTIEENTNANFQIRFTPTSSGVKYAEVSILNSDSNEGVYIFTISGNGLNTSQAALDFDGVNDYVNLGKNPAFRFNNTDAFAFQLWFKTNQTGQRTLLTKMRDQAAGIIDGYEVYLFNGKPGLAITNSNLANNHFYVMGTNTYNDNKWHHLAINYMADMDANTVQIYVDGNREVNQVSQNALTGNFNNVNNNLSIARRGTTSDGVAFSGQIDEVSIWNTTLTQTQIRNGINTSLNGNEPNLVAYYNFNQIESPNGNNTGAIILPNLTTLAGANGTLSGFTLNSTTSNWVNSEAQNFGMPTITGISGDQFACEGNEDDRFFAVFANGSGLNYQWYQNNIPVGTNYFEYSTSAFLVSTSGITNIKCVVSNWQGAVTSSGFNFTVYAKPSVTGFANPSAVCIGKTVTFSGAGASSYSFKDPSFNTISAGAAHLPTISGVYTMIGTDVNSCENSSLVTVTVYALPTISGTISPAPICQGQTATFVGAGALFYFWSGGIQNGISQTPSLSGNYTVTGIDVRGCENSFITSLVINSLPTITIANNSPSLCNGGSTTLTALGENLVSYFWLPGFTNSTLSVSPSVNTVYTVLGTNDKGCQNIGSTSISVIPLPTISGSVFPSNNICFGTVITFSGNGGVTYTYTGGVMNNIPQIASSSDIYTISGTAASGCTNSSTISINVQAPLTVNLNLNPSTAIATQTGISFSGGSPLGGTYSGQNLFNNVWVNSISGFGTYPIRYTYAQGVCVGTAQQNFTVFKANQTLSATNSLDVAIPYSTLPININPVASSGLNTFTYNFINNQFSVVGNNLYLLTVGNFNFEVKQNGNNIYNAQNRVYNLTIVPGFQSIDFEPISLKNLGDPSFQLNATATSGLSVSYSSSSTILGIVGNTATIYGAGVVTITASQLGSQLFNPALDNIQVLTVQKASLTFTINPILPIVYKPIPDAINVGFSRIMSPNSIVLTSSETTVGINLIDANTNLYTINALKPSIVTITADFIGDENYVPYSAFTVVTITKASQFISNFDILPIDKTALDEAFTITVTGGASGVEPYLISSNTAVATVNGLTIKPLTYGFSLITITQPGNDFYLPTRLIQVFGVSRATQVVDFPPLENRIFGDAPFFLNATATSGLSVSYSLFQTSQVLRLNGNSVTIVGAGVVEITANQIGDSRYDFATATQTITILGAQQSLSLNEVPNSVVYGTPPIALIPTVTSGLQIFYSSSDNSIAVVTSNQIRFLSTGVVTITAIQPGNGNFEPSNEIVKVIEVQKANQTLGFELPQFSNYKDSPIAINYTTSSGLIPIFESSDINIVSFDGQNLITIKPGIVTVTGLVLEDNLYNASNIISKIFEVKKLDQELIFENIPRKEIGLPNFTISVTGNLTQNTVIFTSTNPEIAEIIAGNQVKINVAGVTTLTAFVLGDQFYNDSPIAKYILRINRVSQKMVIAPIPTKTVNSPIFNITFTGGSSGLPINFYNLSPSRISLTGTQVTALKAGVATIMGVQDGDLSYAVDTSYITVFIDRLPQSISFNNIPEQVYVSQLNISLQATSSASLPVKYTISDSSVAKLRLSQLFIQNAGIATVTAFSLESEDYFASDTIYKTFIVNKADQQLNFPAIPIKTMGDPAFDLGLEIDTDLDYTVTSSNLEVAKVSNGGLIILGTGTSNIIAYNNGNRNYNPVSSSQTIEVLDQTVVMQGKSFVNVRSEGVYKVLPQKSGFIYRWSYSGTGLLLITDTTASVSAQFTPELRVFFSDSTTDGDIKCSILNKEGVVYRTVQKSIKINKVVNESATLTPIECPPAEPSDCKANYINEFKFGALVSNGTGCPEEGYTDYTSSSLTGLFLMGSSYTAEIKLKRESSGNVVSQAVALWIDYNNNGDFTDPDEFVNAVFSEDTVIKLKNIIIKNSPEFAGARRIRLRIRSGSAFGKDEVCQSFGETGETEDYLISIRPQDELQAPEIFTPNEDGANDFLVIRGVNSRKDNRLTIFDKFGTIKFTKSNYENDWNGMINGEKIAKGTYYYQFINGDRIISGSIEIRY